MDWSKSPIIKTICGILDDKKALNIMALNITEMTTVADYFVICSANTSVAVRALSDDIEEIMFKEHGLQVRRKEGYPAGRWIVLDYGDVIVHIFHREEREFYNLERLWMQGDNYEYLSTQI